jgi:hypothetical protein
MEQATQPRSRILAAGGKPMDRVVQLYHLACEQLTVSIKRLGNASHILQRPDNGPCGFARARTWTAVLLICRLHAVEMHHIRKKGNV